MENKVMIETPEQVSNLLKALTGIDIYKHSREKDIIEHRALLCYMLHYKLDMGWTAIKRFIESNGKEYDHATAMHATKMYPIYKKEKLNYFIRLERQFIIKNVLEEDCFERLEVLEKQYKILEHEYLKALEKISGYNYDFSGYTKNETTYRKLSEGQKEIFDQRASIILKSFDWQDAKDDYEIINCET